MRRAALLPALLVVAAVTGPGHAADTSVAAAMDVKMTFFATATGTGGPLNVFVVSCVARATGGVALTTSVTTCRATMPWGQIVRAPAVTVPGNIAVTVGAARITQNPAYINTCYAGRARFLSGTVTKTFC